MTNIENAERLRKLYLKHPNNKKFVNKCIARPKWNGCDYCDVYHTGECWQQTKNHQCCYCEKINK